MFSKNNMTTIFGILIILKWIHDSYTSGQRSEALFLTYY